MAGGSNIEQRAANRIKILFQEKGIEADGEKADLKLAHKSTVETKDTLAEVHKQHMITVLREEKASQKSGYKKRAAKRLGIPSSSLYQQLKKYDLPEFGKIGHRRGSEKGFKG